MKQSDTQRSAQIQFLDGEQERERNVALRYLRRRVDDERVARETEFRRLKALWQEPILCGDEVTRLEEVRHRSTSLV